MNTKKKVMVFSLIAVFSSTAFSFVSYKNNQLKLEEEKSINKMLMDCKIDGNIVKNCIVRVK